MCTHAYLCTAMAERHSFWAALDEKCRHARVYRKIRLQDEQCLCLWLVALCFHSISDLVEHNKLNRLSPKPSTCTTGQCCTVSAYMLLIEYEKRWGAHTAEIMRVPNKDSTKFQGEGSRCMATEKEKHPHRRVSCLRLTWVNDFHTQTMTGVKRLV